MLNELKGCVIESIEGLKKHSDEVVFTLDDGRQFKMYHYQDCCENVWLEDFEASCDDFKGAMIISAEASCNSDPIEGVPTDESFTWTFYTINTTKGDIWMRWLGESNGYYSESVDCEWVQI